ncbi:MAG: dienelactone hydrolase family protein [Rhodospirillales bacterium]|nr:dienelactone hydrolase family protein [Rhodospirillales bacterium]
MNIDTPGRRAVGRRAVVCGIASAAPLATILADARLARAEAAALKSVSITTRSRRAITAALALPVRTPAPGVLLIHEWWGLNDQIKAVAGELAREGYVALAVDLYGGRVATTPDAAKPLMQAIDPLQATETLVAWADWLRDNPKTSAKIATIGWCLGGGWSLNASLATPVDATVIYYGQVDQPAERLARLNGPVLGHFATRDTWITKTMVDTFEAEMRQADRPLTVYWYEADHAFANPSGARYDQKDAQLAWERTQHFFRTNL